MSGQANNKRQFAVLNKEVCYQSNWLSALEYRIQRDGKDGSYTVVIRKNAVAIIIRRLDGSILFVRQFRFAAETYVWEIPMGGIDEGEDTLSAAKRELSEESGLIADLTFLYSFYPMPGLSPQQVFVFSATVSEGDAQNINSYVANVDTHNDEITERRFLNSDEISSKIRSGEIHGFTLSVLAIIKLT